MAEALGVAASAVGIASFAIETADGIRKLTNFCHDVKDAPTDLQNHISELEDLAELYRLVGEHTKKTANVTALPSQTILNRTMATYKRNLDDLKTLLADLQAEVNKRRIRGSIKYVLKKGTFSKFRGRVESTKTSLGISLTFYNNELRREENRYLLAEIQKVSAIAPCIADMAPQVDLLVAQAVHSAPKPLNVAACNQQLKSRQLKRRLRASDAVQVSSISLRMPAWLQGRTFELAFYYAISGWDVKLRTYNTVPCDSPLFQACRNGEITVVQNLLTTGQASVFDRLEDGKTVLHEIVLRTEPTQVMLLVRLFLDQGVRTDIENDFGNDAIDYLLHWASFEEQTFDEIFEILGDEGELADHNFDPGAWHNPYCTKLLRRSMYPSWHDRPLADRLGFLAEHVTLGFDHTPREYEIVLGSKLTEKVWETTTTGVREMLSKVMGSYGYAIVEHSEDIVLQWRSIIQGAIQHVIEPFVGLMGSEPRPPVWSFLAGHLFSKASAYFPRKHGNGRSWFPDGIIADTQEFLALHADDFFQEAIFSLAKELEIAGLDLVECGHQIYETTNHSQSHIFNDGRWWWVEYFEFRIVGFEYGPRPEDWRIWVSNPMDEWAGDFWNMIENPKPIMPGTWIE